MEEECGIFSGKLRLIFVFVYLYLCVCIYVFVYLYLCVCISVFRCRRNVGYSVGSWDWSLYLCICICVFVFMCLCICICVFVFLYSDVGGMWDIQWEAETDLETIYYVGSTSLNLHYPMPPLTCLVLWSCWCFVDFSPLCVFKCLVVWRWCWCWLHWWSAWPVDSPSTI